MVRKNLGIAFTTTAVLVVAGVLGLSRPPLAAPPAAPPAIDDLVGMWQVKIKQTDLDLVTGDTEKAAVSETWEVRLVKPGVVVLISEASGTGFEAFYQNGILVGGASFLGGEPATASYCLVAQVTGSAGKLKIRGTYSWYSRETEQGFGATFSGKIAKT